MMGASVLNNTFRMHCGGGMKFHRIFRDGVVCCSEAFRLRHVEMICVVSEATVILCTWLLVLNLWWGCMECYIGVACDELAS